MAIRTIVKKGDSVLDKVCRPVTAFNERLWLLLDDMHDTLRAADGAGFGCLRGGLFPLVDVILFTLGFLAELAGFGGDAVGFLPFVRAAAAGQQRKEHAHNQEKG